MTRTTKISTVSVTCADMLNEKFHKFTVTVSDLGKTESINKRKITDALKNVDGYKDHYVFGNWSILETKEELRYMPDDLWMRYSVVVEKDKDKEE